MRATRSSDNRLLDESASNFTIGGHSLEVRLYPAVDEEIPKSVTIATTILFFIPTDAECTTFGEIKVSGDLTGTITNTSTGGVEIDNSGDGSVDEKYGSCSEAQSCV